MSKPISFGLGAKKGSGPAPSAPPIRLSATGRLAPPKKASTKTALHADSDNEDEEEPRHESVTGFSSSGAILSRPVAEEKELIIKNPGNQDWRRRGKNLLPAEVQAQQNGNAAVMVERDEVSTASGLQFAAKPDADDTPSAQPDGPPVLNGTSHDPAPKQLTADEEALAALLEDGSRPKSTAVIASTGNVRPTQRDETDDFRADVANRPDSSTLEDYAVMPVEEFGMAMLRGMGQKRRANGEVIDFNKTAEDNPRKVRKQDGLLGIGAKAAPGMGVELGAWGKADMRKNNRGEGFFTPLMRENKKTGERMTEEEFQNRLKTQKEGKRPKEEEDWRDRRDRNLQIKGRDRDRDRDADSSSRQANGDDSYRDQMNTFSRSSSSRGDKDRDRDRDERDSRSRRDRDRDADRDGDNYESSKSRRDRSRSKERRKDRYRDDERYDSSSSRRSGHRDRSRDRDRDRDRDRYRDRDRDGNRDRDRDRDRDERRRDRR